MALGALRARWPGREKEIQQLYDAFSSDYAPGTCVFVFGGEATGKTGVCRCADGARRARTMHGCAVGEF